MSSRYNVVATFDSSTKAEEALDRLFTQGFELDEVAVLVADRARGRHFTIDAKHKFPEGAALGGAAGGLTGALAAGLSVAFGAMLPLPGDAGPLLAAFAGAGAGGVLGWVVGGLAGLGFDEHEAKLVDGLVEDGHIVLGVCAEQSDKAELAERIFAQGGATSVAT